MRRNLLLPLAGSTSLVLLFGCLSGKLYVLSPDTHALFRVDAP